MAKLSRIFESINDKDSIKQKYYAKKLNEHFMLVEGKIDVAYDISFIETKIISEAFKKDTLDESLDFVDGILKQVRMDEGFGNLMKSAWKGIKKIGAKIKDTLKDMWSGPIVTSIKKWNGAVKKSAEALNSISTDKTLADSLILNDDSYLFEMDNPMENQMNRDKNKKEDAQEQANEPEKESSPEATDQSQETGDGQSSEGDEGDDVSFSFPSKIFLSPAAKPGLVYKSKVSAKYFKFFKVILNEDKSRTLSFAPTADAEFIPMVKFIVKGQFHFLNPGNIKIAPFLPKLFKDIISNPKSGMDKLESFDVIPNGKVLDVTVADNTETVRVGKIAFVNKNGMLKSLNADGTDEVEGGETPADGTETPADGTETPADGDKLPATTEPEEEKGGFGDDKEDATFGDEEEALTPDQAANKKIINDAIEASGIKNNADKFYDNMDTTPEETWGAFNKFAGNGANQYNIANVLSNSSSNIDEMKTYFKKTSTYLAYLANIGPFIKTLKSQSETNPPKEFDVNNYVIFLNSVSVATDALETEVNRSLSVEKIKKSIYTGDENKKKEEQQPEEQKVDEPLSDDEFNKMKL